MGFPEKKKKSVLSFKIGTLKTESCRGALSVFWVLVIGLMLILQGSGQEHFLRDGEA